MKITALAASIALVASIAGGQEILDQVIPPTAEAVTRGNLKTLNSMVQSALMTDGVTIDEALAKSVALLEIEATIDGHTVRHEIAGTCHQLTVTGFAGKSTIEPCDKVAQ